MFLARDFHINSNGVLKISALFLSISKCNRLTLFAIYGKANRDKIAVVEIVGQRPTEFIADFIVPLLLNDIKPENTKGSTHRKAENNRGCRKENFHS